MDRNVSFPLTTSRRTFGFRDERAIRDAVFGSRDFVQRLQLDTTLDVHRGCVNSICWNDTGSLILSGSDDKKLCFTNPHNRQLVTSVPSGHRSNIFSAKFLPYTRDQQVVSCSGDGCIIYTDVESPATYGQNIFNCHHGTTYEVVTLPSDPNTFMSCGEDTMVRWYDLRIKTSCSKENCEDDVLINCRRAVTALSVNPVLPYHLAVGCSDSSVLIFDRRMLGTKLSGNSVGRGMQGILSRFCPAHLTNKYSRPTSLTYSRGGDSVLVSYSSDYIYLYSSSMDDEGGGAKGYLGDGSLAEASGEELGDDRDVISPGNPVKRLRLRGDWSDTGPRARPRSEQTEEERPRPTIIQRMSEMLARWLEESPSASGRSPPRDGRRQTDPASSSASSSQPSPESPQTGGAASDGATLGAQSARDLISKFESGASPAGGGSKAKVGGAAGGPSKPTKGVKGQGDDRETKSDDTDRGLRQKEKVDGASVKGSASCSSLPGDSPGSETKSKSEEKPSSASLGQSMKEPCQLGADGGKAAGLGETSQDGGSSVAMTDEGAESVRGDGSRSSKEEDKEKKPHTVNEDDKKGIFALGDRMEDKNPQPRLTKQSSLEHTKSRRRSVCEGSRSPSELASSAASSSSSLSTTGITETRSSLDEGKEKGPKEEGRREEGARGGGGKKDSSGASDGRSGSSRSMTCSESDSEEDMAVMGAERVKKTPAPREAPHQPRERVRSEAEMRLRELFKTRKQERETEANFIKNVYSPSVKMVFKGHRNSRTMIKEANFWGDHYIVSGSDCGHIFFWDRHTAKLAMLLEGDKHVVNCVQPHPWDPILATSGIDYNVKLWAPLAEMPYFPENSAEVIRINELMLEETRDTITVPPSFMLRMLASMNHIRGDRRRSQDRPSTSESSDD
ncbi:DDB1- and CUL4-associated factor 6-like [Diadema antillarum]|uniref:DDB1- and CUL4-associated factor 6-like n=1 Tax=Diadema antillarum TaxID=105358 RepID=UPI003A8C4A17